MINFKNIVKYIFFAIGSLYLSSCGLAKPPQGVVKIATIPGDAEIRIDGILTGNSPTDNQQFFTISLPEGKHTINSFLTVNEELDKTASKMIFVANQTEQVVTLTLEDRLTDIGKVKKTERDAEETKKKIALEEKMRVDAAKEAAAKKRIQARIPPPHDGAFVFDTKKQKWVELPKLFSDMEPTEAEYRRDFCVQGNHEDQIPYILLENVGEFLVKGANYPITKLSLHNAYDKAPRNNQYNKDDGPCIHRDFHLAVKKTTQDGGMKAEISSKKHINGKHIAVRVKRNFWYLKVSK